MPTKSHFVKCYLCDGDRFFDLGSGRHYPCPLCRMDGCVLVKDGQYPVVPGALVRRIIEDLEAE